MGETGNTAKAPKKSFWKGLKAEYKKIIWPDKATFRSRRQPLSRELSL